MLLLRLSFVASCLSASNLRLALLTYERQLSRSEASCFHDLWLISSCASCLFSCVFETLSFSELAEEDCFGYAYVFHPGVVASPAQLHLKQDERYAGQAGSF